MELAHVYSPYKLTTDISAMSMRIEFADDHCGSLDAPEFAPAGCCKSGESVTFSPIAFIR